MDSLNAPVSSRGRRIVPPLSYWTGEVNDRLIKKKKMKRLNRFFLKINV